MMREIKALLIIVVGLLCIKNSYAQSDIGGVFTYNLVDYRVVASGEVEVKGLTVAENPVEVVVPNIVKGQSQTEYSVVGIGSGAFKSLGTEASALRSLVLPEGMRYIGEEAFMGCNQLQKVQFPQSLERVGDRAFGSCELLELDEKTFPDAALGMDCFEGTAWLELQPKDEPVYLARIFYKLRPSDNLNNGYLEIKSGTTQIAGGACMKNTQVKTLVLPSSVRRIGKSAFANCSNLKNAYLGQVGEIEEYAFFPCEKLELVQLLVSVAPTLSGKQVFHRKETVSFEYPKGAEGFGQEPWKTFHLIPINVLVITDNAKTTLGNEKNGTYDEVLYSRKYSHDKWQSLYLPFSMNYEDWQEHFEVASLNNVHQYDNDNDGAFERTELEVKFIRNGVIEPNVPYMIRAKNADAQAVQTITIQRPEGVSVQLVENGQIDCSSTTTKYTFIGGYQLYSGVDHYVMLKGALRPVINPELQLGGLRWHLSMTDRHGGTSHAVNKILVVESGGVSTGIDTSGIGNVEKLYDVYDLSGRLVLKQVRIIKGLPHGIYIVNGKKTIL